MNTSNTSSTSRENVCEPRLTKAPPPLWFVTNGKVTVGPVTTNTLVRGVAAERVPEDCLVRERSWTAWRHIERIREIGALRRAQARYGKVRVDKTRWARPRARESAFDQLENDLKRAIDPGEVLLYCLTEAMSITSACVGAVHRRRPPYVGLVTSCAAGPGMHRRLGNVVPATEPVMRRAARGEILCEKPRYGFDSGRVSERLGALPACSGVAMAPIRCFGRLYAVIELGRPDHGFRERDRRHLMTITELASERLGIVRNWHQV